MNQQQALNVLVQAANVAQSRGAFNLQEASAISNAISTFVTEETALADEPKEETTVEESESE